MKTELPAIHAPFVTALLKAAIGSSVFLVALSVQSQFTYWTNSGTITIMRYVGSNSVVSTPATVGGLPVVALGNSVFGAEEVKNVLIAEGVTNFGSAVFSRSGIEDVLLPNSLVGLGDSTFYYCSNLTEITIPANVRRIGGRAFQNCTALTAVYFKGNAPSIDETAFFGATNVTLYTLPGTAGWDTALAGLASGFIPTSALVPHAIWRPQIESTNASLGIRTNVFGFTINWASGMPVAVDASPDLVAPVWTPIQTNILTSDSFYFSDPQWTNYATRFYRVRWPN
jgi:hypothetical protein